MDHGRFWGIAFHGKSHCVFNSSWDFGAENIRLGQNGEDEEWKNNVISKE